MIRDQLILNRYRVLAEAGSGGFGTVQVAWDTRIQRKVAIKCIELEDSQRLAGNGAHQDAAAIKPVPGLDEARTAALLTDPNIVTVYDFEVQGNTALLIMEYIEGVTLSTLLKEYGDYLTLDMVAALFSSIAHALEVAHHHQVLHLDIKPDNVLINRQGQVKVTDFGLAKLADASGFGAAQGGTIGYMPLEQMRGENLDARCDEWALASVTFEILTGSNPFLAPNLEKAEKAIDGAELVLPSLCWDKLNAALDDVMFYALDPKREERYNTISDYAEEMEKFLGDARRGHRELAVLVGDAEEEAVDERAEEGRSEGDVVPSLSERLTHRQRTIASHAWGGIASALVAFLALSPLEGAFVAGQWAHPEHLALFWGLFALITLTGFIKPSVGVLIAYEALAVMLVVQGAPAVGIGWGTLTALWWYGMGRHSAAAHTALLVPVLGVMGANQFIPLVAGLALSPRKAVGTTLYGLVLALVLSAMGAGSLLGFTLPRVVSYTGSFVQSEIGRLITQPSTACIAAAWLISTFLLAGCNKSHSRILSLVGLVLCAGTLVAGLSAEAWFVSAGHTWMPSASGLVTTILALVVGAAVTFIFPKNKISANIYEE